MAHTLFNINNNSSMLSVAAYRFVSFIEGIGSKLQKRKEQRDTYKTLQGLSDRELNDIGISRGDIRSIANDTWEENYRRDHVVRKNPNLRGFV
mgnify:FL=1|jgi:uncharacterized protein YjiS (DUF1127 family)